MRVFIRNEFIHSGLSEAHNVMRNVMHMSFNFDQKLKQEISWDVNPDLITMIDVFEVNFLQLLYNLLGRRKGR